MSLRDLYQKDETTRPATPSRPGAFNREAWERNRLTASIALFGGTALLLGLPFALRADAEFFLPLTASLVIAICLVPFLEWLERRRIPSPLAALIALAAFLFVANTALVLMVVPASAWMAQLPGRISSDARSPRRARGASV